jgi:hypothetical protein
MSISDVAHPVETGTLPNAVTSVVSAASLPISRRTWLKKIAEWTSTGAVLKQVGTAVAGVGSGGAAVYRYLEPRLNTLAEKDFVVGSDTTDVWLNGDGRYVDVKISRKFKQEATKTGYYRYQRFCEGAWNASECSMSLQKPFESPETVDLTVGTEAEGGNVLSVIHPRSGKSISLSKGDSLVITLVSEEKIEKVKGGYRLRLNAQFTRTSFTLHAKSVTLAAQDIECFAYAEKQGQVLLAVSPENALTLNNCTNGLEYLISWVGRSVPV